MRIRAQLIQRLVAGAGLALGLSLSLVASCGSNENRCEEACDMWSTCETWGASCWAPTYESCYDLCMEEDDWGSAYLGCLRRNEGACCAMEDCG